MLFRLRLIVWFLFALVLLWGAGYGMFVASVLEETPQDQTRKTDAIIVLTGGNFRVDTGLDLFAIQMAPRLFITGVHDTVTMDDIIRKWSGLPNGSRALPACCMELGHKALTTIENARETKDWAEKENVHSMRLVTSPYHMPRAMREFKSLMPEKEFVPHVVVRDTLSPRDQFFWHITFIEYHKWVFRLLYLSVMPR